jgi:hypothetical protein
MMSPVPAGFRHPILPWNSHELLDGVRTIAVQRIVVPVLAVAGFAHGDDGRPLPFDEHEEGTVGIASAAARVDAAGGTLSIRRQGDRGSRIVVRMLDDPPVRQA